MSVIYFFSTILIVIVGSIVIIVGEHMAEPEVIEKIRQYYEEHNRSISQKQASADLNLPEEQIREAMNTIMSSTSQTHPILKATKKSEQSSSESGKQVLKVHKKGTTFSTQRENSEDRVLRVGERSHGGYGNRVIRVEKKIGRRDITGTLSPTLQTYPTPTPIPPIPSTVERPEGVSVLAGLSFLGGILMAVAGLISSQIFGSIGAFSVIIGIVTIVIGWGLWSLQDWARLITMIGSVLGIVGSLFSLPSWGAGSLVLMLINGAIAWYLNSDNVKKAFEKSKSSY